LLVGLLQTRSFVVSTTSSATGLIIAAFLAQLVRGDISPDLAAQFVPIVVIVSGVATMLLGLIGIGRIVAFTPQPIFAGFVSGVGVLILLSQTPKLIGMGRWGEAAPWFAGLDPGGVLRSLVALSLVALMLWIGRRRPQLPNIAIGFIVGLVIYHALRAIAPGLAPSGVIGAMPSFDFTTPASLLKLPSAEAWGIALERWKQIGALALPLALVASLESMMARRLAESLTDMERAPMRNLAATGLGSILSGAMGGIAVSGSPAQVIANFRAGGRGRISAISVSLCLLLLAVAFPGFTALVPSFVPSAVLVVVALRLVDANFLLRTRVNLAAEDGEARRRALFDLFTFAAVMLPTALGEIILGVGLGIVMSVAVFLVRMGRPVVRRHSRGDTRLSKRIRGGAEAALLAEHGNETVVLELEGVLFFGNADDLAQEIGRLAPSSRQLVLDMRRISDIDTTGASILAQAIDRARVKGCAVVLCHVGPALRSLYTVDTEGLRIFPDLDSSLEWAEDTTIARQRTTPEPVAGLPIGGIDMCQGLDDDDIARLANFVTPVHYAAGSVLCHAGEPADRMWMLLSGSVSIRANERSSRRIIALGRGTTVGEMALIEGGMRSATAIADEPVDALLLTKDGFDALLRDEPRLANAMMHNLARELVRRLRRSTMDLARSE
jgi:sulfate permease, SulP family